MADEAVTPLNITDIGDKLSRHHAGEAARFGQLQQQVTVIVQQAVMIQARFKALLVTCQQANDITEVRIVGKERSAVLAPVHDVVAGSLVP